MIWLWFHFNLFFSFEEGNSLLIAPHQSHILHCCTVCVKIVAKWTSYVKSIELVTFNFASNSACRFDEGDQIGNCHAAVILPNKDTLLTSYTIWSTQTYTSLVNSKKYSMLSYIVTVLDNSKV